MKNIFYVFLLYNLFLANLFAGVDTDGTRTGTRFENWYNSGNQVEIRVDLDGNHASGGNTDLSNKFAHVIVCFSASTSFDDDDWLAMDDEGVTATRIGDDNFVEFTITDTHLSNTKQDALASGPSPASYTHFKFAILIDTYNLSGDGTTPGSSFDVDQDVADLIPVVFTHPVTNADEPYLKHDVEHPTVTVTTPADNGNNGNNRKYFNFETTAIEYTIDEDLNTNDSYPSAITLVGDYNNARHEFDPYDDSGNNYSYTLTGTQLDVGAQEADVSADFNPADDGCGYDIRFTVYDAAGNYKSHSYPRNNIIHDETLPTITSISTDQDTPDAIKLGGTVEFNVNFSEKVSSSGNLNITFNGSGTAATATILANNISTTNEAAAVYTVATGNVSNQLDITDIELAPGGEITDLANNAMAAEDPPADNLSTISNFRIDGVVPTITAVQTTSDSPGNYSTGEDINITVLFSEPLTMVDAAGAAAPADKLVVTLDTGDTNDDKEVDITGIDNMQSVPGTYTVRLGDEKTDKLEALSIARDPTTSKLVDGAGNEVESFLIPDGQNLDDVFDINVETTAPTVKTIIGDPSLTSNNSYGKDAVIPIIVSFINGAGSVTLEEVFLDGTFTIDLDTGVPDVTVDIQTIDWASTATGNYTVAEGHNIDALTVTALSISGGSIEDQYGNEMDASPVIPDGGNLSDDMTLIIDGVRPKITEITSDPDDGDHGIGSVIDITITFDENITLAGANLELVLETGSTVTDYTLNYPPANNATPLNTTDVRSITAAYTVAEDHLTADLGIASIPVLAAGATLKDIVDVSANLMNDFSIPANENLADNSALNIDGVRPVIESLTTPDHNTGTYGIGEVIPIKVTFSKPVTLTGGNFLINLETGATVGQVEIPDISFAAAPYEVEGNYTVSDGEETDALTVKEIALSAGSATLKDDFGNSFADGYPVTADLNVSKTIKIDGNRPTRPAIVSVTPTGGNVVANAWNSTNTGVIVRVPIMDTDNPDDETLIGGTIMIYGKIGENTGTYVPLVDDDEAHTIISAPYADITIDQADIEVMESNTYEEGGEIFFSALIKDEAGNQPHDILAQALATEKAGAKLLIDTTPFDILSITSTDHVDDPAGVMFGNGFYKLGDEINITVNFTETTGSLIGGEFYLTPNAPSANATRLSISSLTDGSARFTYTVLDNDEAHSGETAPYTSLEVISLALQDNAYIIDNHGNPTLDVDLPIGQKLQDNHNGIRVDGVVPGPFTVGGIETVSGNVVAGMWNSYNTQVQVTVPWDEDDPTLLPDQPNNKYGEIQLLAKVAGGSFENLGEPKVVKTNEITAAIPAIAPNPAIPQSVTITIEAINPSDITTDLEEITGFADGATVSISAIITDKFGNTTTGTASATTLFVDQTLPELDDIPQNPLRTAVSGDPVNSIAVDNYWNIDTDELIVDFGNLVTADVDDNIIGGTVQLYGNVASKGWLALGTVESITAEHILDNFTISINAQEADGIGIEELSNDASLVSPIEWTAQNADAQTGVFSPLLNTTIDIPASYKLDGETILLRAKIWDKAGNFPAVEFWTISNNLIIDGMVADNRPRITEATADREGWWGPNSKDVKIAESPIQIWLTASDAIYVTPGVIPTISLETGTIVGTASYESSSTTDPYIITFHYEPLVGETTVDPGTGEGEPLAFKIDGAIGKAVIDPKGGDIYEKSGNLLFYNAGDPNKSPLIPYPGVAVSLDKMKNLIIDGVAPDDFLVGDISTFDADIIQQKSGYYNGLVRTITITVPLPNDLVTITKDLTLASAQNEDCWTNYTDLDNDTGQDCGKIQLIAYALPEGSIDTPNEREFLTAHTILFSDLTGNDSYVDLNFTHTEFEDPNEIAVQHPAGQFADENLLYISARITDLAGNYKEGSVSATSYLGGNRGIKVDQTPPADGTLTPNDPDDDMITGSVVTNAGDGEFYNIKPGYWNSHNTGVQLTVPLPSNDESLTDGTIQILGKKSGGEWERLGVWDANDNNFDVSNNINSTENDNVNDIHVSIVPSASTFLIDPGGDIYKYVEDIAGYDEGVDLAFTARVFDVAGNYTEWPASLTTLTVDALAPTVEAVTSDVGNIGTQPTHYVKEGGTVTIIVDASEDIFDTRGPADSREAFGTDSDYSTLKLDVGDPNPDINFDRIDGDKIYYNYTVLENESSEDALPTITADDHLRYLAGTEDERNTSLALKDDGDLPDYSALMDAAGNNLNRRLFGYGNVNALNQKNSIIIDTDPLGVTFTYFEGTTDNISDKLVSVIDGTLIIRATFDDKIPVLDSPTLEISYPPHLGNGITGDPKAGSIINVSVSEMTVADPYEAPWYWDYSLTLIDSVHTDYYKYVDDDDITEAINLTITPTALDKAGNPIDYTKDDITDEYTEIIDADAVIMDNEEPRFLLLPAPIPEVTPELTGITPSSNSFVNSSKVAYELSEDLASGSITWKFKAGTSPEDPDIPADGYVINLTGDELLESNNVNTNNPNTLLHELTNGSLTLKDSAKYNVTWTATDLADNEETEPGETNAVVSTTVTYDITNPKVYLDYKFDVLSSGHNDTICWAYFNERMSPDPDQKPKISIEFRDYPATSHVDEGAELTNIVNEDMTIFSTNGVDDSTKWFYVGEIPTAIPASLVAYCSTYVTITAKDLAGNELPVTGCDEDIVGHDAKTLCDAGAADHSDASTGHYFSNTFSVTGSNNQDTLNYSILVVDNSAPVCSLSYVNINKPLLTDEVDDYLGELAHGKSGDIIRITASLNEEFGKLPDLFNPTLKIDFSYPENTLTNSSFDSSLSALLQDSLGVIDSTAQRTPYFINGDSSVVWYLELPDSAHGLMTVTIQGTDRAVNSIGSYTGPLESDIENKSRFRIDNIVPDTLVTGLVSGYGTPTPTPGWLNGITDSIAVVVPIPADDASLLINPYGNVHIELKNVTRNQTVWVPIPRDTIPASKHMVADSIRQPGNNFPYFRTFAEIDAELDTSAELRQEDIIQIRAAVSDRAGNKTYYDSSSTILEYDPYKPIISAINGGNVYNEGLPLDTLISNDYLKASWTGASYDIDVDTLGETTKGSGISNYDYRINTYSSENVFLDTLIDWRSNELDMVVELSADRDDYGLKHNHKYNFLVRAVDSAGNISETVHSDTIYRLNTGPVITIDSTINAYEDNEYKVPIHVVDPDTGTVIGEQFQYYGYIQTDESNWFPWYPHGETNYFEEVDPGIDTNGIITWTPTPRDTGNFQMRVTVVDRDNLSDSIYYMLKVIPTNDRPYFRFGDAWEEKYGFVQDLELPDTSFGEDLAIPFSMPVTKFIHDEDNNDSTEITWQAVAIDTTARPGYPRTSLFFGPGTPEIVKQRLRDRYLQQNRMAQSKHQFQGELKTVGNGISAKSLGNNIEITFPQDADSISWAMIKPDSNYYGVHRVIFMATDNYDSSAVDTMILTITATNDRPQWSAIPDQTMWENDTLRFDLGPYVIDVDDTLLHFTLEGITNAEKMAIEPKAYSSENLGDSAQFIPEKLWSDYAVIQAIAKDGSNDTAMVLFTIDVIRIPRPNLTINVVQNNIFTNYYDVLITDTIAKARNVYLEVQNEIVSLDTVGPHTFRGHHKFISPGTYSIEVFANALVGDTTIFRSIGLALARTLGRWSGSSPDGLFKVAAEPGAVNMDQSILVVDSTMFKKGYTGSYKLGDEVRVFTKPVEVSFASYDDALALYQRNTDNTWTELPSYNEQGRIRAYTDRMGYFRLGRKTLIVPGLTSLGQNYPNPFNPVTNITYDVGFVDGAEQQVNLSIYNLLGQQVITLVNDQRSIGRHSVKWYGKDKSGISVASGMYFVHMTTSTGKVQTKKVMLLR